MLKWAENERICIWQTAAAVTAARRFIELSSIEHLRLKQIFGLCQYILSIDDVLLILRLFSCSHSWRWQHDDIICHSIFGRGPHSSGIAAAEPKKKDGIKKMFLDFPFLIAHFDVKLFFNEEIPFVAVFSDIGLSTGTSSSSSIT